MQDPDDLLEEPKSSTPTVWSRLHLLIVVALGVALIGYLLSHIGLRAVLATAGSIGFGGFGLLCVMAFVVFALVGPAWYVLLPPTTHPSLPLMIWARMVRDAVSESLPFSPVGGMILGVRAAALFGMSSRLAVASLIVDVTAELIAQVLYVGVGLSLLLTRGTHSAATASLERSILIGIGVLSLCGVGLLAVQRRGIGWLSGKLAARVFPASGIHMSGVAADLQEIHRSPLRLVVSTLIHLCGWIAAALSTWVAFRLIGERVDISAVIALESLVYAARSLAFFVPNALGVQEAAYTVLAPLVGIGKEFALAVSLLRRARDIAVGIPILLAYQLLEGRRALARRVQT
ncbi:MAG TPA: lysylphosphatidylglycerol synthase domain-containing protein [Steroidobacteraceae bacterium]|jgi:putative membrane protein